MLDTPFSPSAPSQIVGRESHLQAVEGALRNPATTPRIIGFLGEGGIGKTRLLEETLKLSGDNADILSVLDLVDLYDTPTHTRNGLAEALHRAFPVTANFGDYRAARRKLDRLRVAGDVKAIREQRQQTLDAFTKDMRHLAAQQRVVLVLDTAEKLVYGGQFRSTMFKPADSWTWLLESLPDWGNVVIVVAGRPGAEPLLREAESRGLPVSRMIVDRLEPSEIAAFFEAKQHNALSTGNTHLAGQIADMDAVLMQRVGELAEGRPIFLTLFLDLLASGSVTAEELLRSTLAEVWKSKVLERIVNLPEVGPAILAMGRVPKGVDAPLLALLLETSETVARNRLAQVRGFTFVKHRGQRTFLHDELYELLQTQYFYDDEDAPDARRAYEATLRYYDEAQDRIRIELDTLYAPVELMGKGRESLKFDRIAEAHRHRRELHTEVVSYVLHHEPVRGFKRYYRYVRDAILSGDVQADIQLESEVLSFWAERDPGDVLTDIGGIERRSIEGMLAIRPVVRAMAEEDYEDVLRQAEMVRATHPEIVAETNTKYVLAIYEAAAHAQLSGPDSIRKASQLLDDAIDALKLQPRDENIRDPAESLRAWRTKAVLALGYRVRGFLERVRGQMSRSVADYTEASRLWREINLEVELALTQNNMGFAQSELGNNTVARQLVTSALALRRKLGSRAQVALSINTLATIYVREGKFAEARETATRALALFRVLEDRYGTGLALIALAEALRREAISDMTFSVDEKVARLREACDRAREAQELFDDHKHPNNSRLVEVWIELGCASREWILVRANDLRSGDDLERLKKDSRAAFETAAKLAGKNFLYRHVDALVNISWLGHITNDQRLCDDAATRAEAAIPNEYRLQSKGSGKRIIERTEAQSLIWPQLGKLHTFRGHWALKAWHDAKDKEGAAAQAAVREATYHYALGLQYNALYNPDNRDHRDAQRAQEAIYKSLGDVYGHNTRPAIWEVVAQFETEFGLEQKSELRRFLELRGM